MNKLVIITMTVAAVTALSACGGGGSGDAAPAATTPTAIGNTEATSGEEAPISGVTRFIEGPSTRYFMRGSDFDVVPSFEGYTQRADGAVTEFAGDELTGEALVKDIQGDEDYAMGRWAAGVFTEDDPPWKSVTFTESDSAGYHYVLFNSLSSMPSNGSAQCGKGNFTTPTYAGGVPVQSANRTARVSASLGDLRFDPRGATFDLSLTVVNQESSGSRAFTGKVERNFWASAPLNQRFVAVLGRATGDAVLFLGTYSIGLDDGTNYVGAFQFRCAF
jgi:hypothetical protein